MLRATRRTASGFTLIERLVVIAFALLLLGTSGCSKADSHGALERELKMKEDAAGSLESQAVRMEKKTYPKYGEAWAVDLTGKQITSATFDELVRVGRVSELNLSKTNITDADMKRVNGVAGVCTHLDLSNTAITDTGLGELNNMHFIKEINLASTKCTPAGVDALKKRLQEHPVFKPQPNVKLK
jgi:hypothetical protein